MMILFSDSFVLFYEKKTYPAFEEFFTEGDPVLEFAHLSFDVTLEMV